ncbi:DUF4352 domain-containing protein [Jeotgalicoccus sp. WY2]|uniref:DUF4352 domain-containing protein n=1 Tax=Jeotgalicoccus sp. WY2 TaxID=2708346 RepID=UPI001BD28AB5|nr:DUF4352 domain-containing protein [Jeotgalicoccus sp. WY2]
MMKKYLYFAGIALLLMMAACGNSESEQEPEENTEADETVLDDDEDNASEQEPEESAAANEGASEDGEYHHVGDTVELEESIMINQPYTLTVNDFTLTREFKGKPMEEYLIGFEEDTGFYLAVVDVTVTNNGEEAFKFEENSNLSLMETDREGFNYMEAYAVEEELTTDINPGESLTMELPFVVNVNNSEGNYYFYIDPPSSVFQEVYELTEQ